MAADVVLPVVGEARRWHVEVDTAAEDGRSSGAHAPGATVPVPARTVLLLRAVRRWS